MNEDDFGGPIPEAVDDAIESALDDLRARLLGGAAFDIGQPNPSRKQMARAWIEYGVAMWETAFDDPELVRLYEFLRAERANGPQKDLN